MATFDVRLPLKSGRKMPERLMSGSRDKADAGDEPALRPEVTQPGHSVRSPRARPPTHIPLGYREREGHDECDRKSDENARSPPRAEFNHGRVRLSYAVLRNVSS